VPIDYSVDLRLVADVVDADPQEIQALNPGLLRLTTPPPGVLRSPSICICRRARRRFISSASHEIPEDRRTQWRYHRVTPDDTLASVARGYHVTQEQLAAANQLHADDSLEQVEALVIPLPLPSAPATRVAMYRARRGDTLVTIADRFGVSLDDLRHWNHVAGTAVVAGQHIRVEEPLRMAPRSRNRRNSSADAGVANGSHSRRAATKAHGSSASGKKYARGAKEPSSRPATKNRGASTTAKSDGSKKSRANHKSTKKKNIQK
jgi:membrane-bound lytic murein transglycosylase D